MVTGARGRRCIMLLNRPAWRDLHSVDDLWTTADHRAVRLLFGVVEMTLSSQDQYVVTAAKAVDGYAGMLRALTSGTVKQEDVRVLDYLGTQIMPRRWSPLAGMVRRGNKTVRALQRAHGLEDRTMDQLIERIRTMFMTHVVTPEDDV